MGNRASSLSRHRPTATRAQGLGCGLAIACLFLLSVAPQLCATSGAEATKERRWAFTTYGGLFTSTDSLRIWIPSEVPEFEEAQIAVVALSYEVWRPWRPLGVELEGQVGTTFGDAGHEEFNLVGVVRWNEFPWNEWWHTTFAYGAGFSMATERPTIETRKISEPDVESRELLGYLMLELEFAPAGPDASWSIVTRVHHRSSAGGVFGPRGLVSNYICAGLKFRF